MDALTCATSLCPTQQPRPCLSRVFEPPGGTAGFSSSPRCSSSLCGDPARAVPSPRLAAFPRASGIPPSFTSRGKQKDALNPQRFPSQRSQVPRASWASPAEGRRMPFHSLPLSGDYVVSPELPKLPTGRISDTRYRVWKVGRSRKCLVSSPLSSPAFSISSFFSLL